MIEIEDKTRNCYVPTKNDKGKNVKKYCPSNVTLKNCLKCCIYDGDPDKNIMFSI